MSPVARLMTTKYVDGDVRSVWTWCPGCDRLHPFRLAPGDERGVFWEWDGNLESPTFSPSLLCYSSVHLCEGEHAPTECTDAACAERSHALGWRDEAGEVHWSRRNDGHDTEDYDVRGHNPGHTREPAFGPCHSFLKAGRWEFLGDSAHELAGQTVDMVPLPDGWAGE